MSRKLINKKNNRGVSLAEMLIVVAILLILMAVAVPSVITIQRNLRQTELDAKAEMIYVAVQNKLSKMKAGGNTAVFQVQADNGNGVYKLADIPGDADSDVDNIVAGDICYFTSSSLNVSGSAASFIMDQNTMDESLLNNHWVIEFNPKTSVVYAVFYSEDLADCAGEYISDFNKYDLSLRFKNNRVQDGSKVGYYGGGSVGFSNTVSNLTPVLNIVNNEKLTVNVSCTLPVSVSDFPVFVMKFEDTAGKQYTKYYAFWQCSSEYLQKIKSEAQKEGAEVDNSTKSMQKVGRTFTLSLVLDDLSSEETRFVNQYGENSSHSVKLQSGTPLKVTVTVKCPGNYTITQNLSDSKITNSLFADANCKDAASTDKDLKLNTAYGTTEDNSAEIHYARHLQNLDESSGVNEQVKYARQSSDITLAENAGQTEEEDWYETYSDNFFNGLIGNNPNFKPIKNSNLVSYNGEKEGTSYRIMNLIEQTSTDVGLFAELQYGQTLKNIVLTGAKVTSTGVNTAAGALVGNIKGNAVIDHCQVFLTPADINGKTNRNVWISGKTAGGLVGMVSSGDNVTIKDSGASTVVGEHQYDAVSSKVTAFNSDSVGGLIGQISSGAIVNITRSYADGYLVGKTTGGLVGKSSGTTRLESCYAAGFMTYDMSGAGLVCGQAILQNSYTVIHRQDMVDKNQPYYAIAESGSTSGKVYFSANTVNVTDSPVLGESIGALAIQDMKNSLGNDFQTDTASSVPYNLMGQTLSTYSYPVLKTITHYGDWQADFQVGALVYYEKYKDAKGNISYGFYGANVDSTLKDDPELTVLGDGYGIVYLAGESNLPDNVSVTINDRGRVLVNEANITITGSSYYPVSGGTNNYSIYPFPKEWVNTEEPSGKFYLKAEIKPNGASKADYYYFNPHFAKSVVYLTDADAAMPALNSDSTIAIRTARHLYMLSEHYETYAAATTPCTYLQERNIAYTSYEWADFSLREAGASTQSPIAGGETAFKAIYDGQCNWITDVSFTTDTGLYVGFIGHNEGTLKNIVLRASYEEGSDNNYYVGRSGDIQNNQSVYMGVLTGKNESTGRISNCAVAGYYIAGSDGTIHAYQNSYLYAGGLVGTNVGNISSSAADTPTLRLSSTYANVSLGGFAGNNAGITNNCYALGHIEVAFAKGGTVSIAGFAGRNSAVIRNSYCATALTASGDTTTAYGFAPAGGSVSNCRYLNNGTYSYVNHMHSFNFDKGVGTSTLFSDMRVTVGSSQEAKKSYDFNNTQTNSRRYPFRAVVTDAEGKLVHFGDWLDDENMGNIGIFYWEKETNGSNNGYHFTYLGTVDGEAVGGTSLCTAHDDGGVVSEYGYGYFELNKGSVTALQVSGAEINGSSTFDSKSGVYNETASKALEEQMNLTLADGTRANYYFYAFTTRTKTEADAAKGGDDNGNYVCLSGSEPNSTWTLKYKSATEGTSADYTFTVSPFFANAMSMEGGKTITATDGTGSDYSKTPGTEANQYEVRSIQQLQYINWNAEKKNAHTVIMDSETSNSRHYNNVKDDEFPYLIYVKGNNPYASSTFKAYWSQSHDMGNQAFNFTPIGCLFDTNGNSASANCYIAYFGGSYLGNAYRIKNIDIRSNAACVGLFGITVSARLEGIILYNDDPEIAIEVTGGTNWYNLGGLVGYAAKGSASNAGDLSVIKNCSVSGYTIIDSRSSEGGWGGANIGGLIGATNTNIINCSAVNDIKVNCTFGGTYQNVRVGGLIGALRAEMKNCYAGGSISRTVPDRTDGYANIWIGGLTGGIVMKDGGNLNTLIGSVTQRVYISNCYSYVQLPAEKGQIKSVLAIASNGEMQSGMFGAVPEPNIYIINSYCYMPAVTGSFDYKNQKDSYLYQVDIGKAGPGRVYLSNNGNSPYLTYDKMDINSTNSKLFDYLGGTNNSGTNRLDYGAGYSNVTTTEGNANVPIDGKYSYPGTNAALEGKNYPFPAIVQQKDLTFSTASNPKYVYVHYGDWPINGPFWERGRDSMDIFQDMNMDGTYQGYATKVFYLNPNGETLGSITAGSFTIDSDIAQILSVDQLSDGRVAVTIMAVNTGTTSVKLSGTNVEFTLEVTANIDIAASLDKSSLAVGDTGNLLLSASSIVDTQYPLKKSFEISESSTWTFWAENISLVQIDPDENQKNKFTIQREDMGKVTLKVTFSYQYDNPDNTKAPAMFTADTYVDVLQPNTVGLSDGLRYNIAYLGATDKNGQDTSYHVDKPTVSGVDFFLFTDAKDKTMTINSISVNDVVATKVNGEKYTTSTAGTKDGYYINLNAEGADELYKYLPGNIYYLTSTDELQPKENVVLKISMSIDGQTYYLQVILAEVITCKEVKSEYWYEEQYTQQKKLLFDKNILSGIQNLPTLDEAIAVNSGFLPSGMTLEGWKDESGTVYAPGSAYDFAKNQKFEAVFRTIKVTLDANGGQISYAGQIGRQYVLEVNTNWGFNLSEYSNATSRAGYKLLGQEEGYAWRADDGHVYGMNENVDITAWKTDFTLYAQWVPKRTIIALKASGVITNGKDYQTISAVYDSKILQTAAYVHPTKVGEMLCGWSIDGRIVIKVNDSGELELVPDIEGYTDSEGKWIYDPINEYTSIAFQAEWVQANKLTLENGKEGEIYSEYIKDNADSLGDGYDNTSISYGEGWTLEGWYTEKNRATGQKILDATGKVVSAKEGYSKKLEDDSYVLELNGDKTLYACWKKDSVQYVLTNVLVPGEKYLIVNSDQVGTGKKAFGRKGTADQTNESVEVKSNGIIGKYIEDDMTGKSYTLFECTDDFALRNTFDGVNYYIQIENQSSSFWGYTMTTSKNEATKWNYQNYNLFSKDTDSKGMHGYFYFNNNGFIAWSSKNGTGNTYLYRDNQYSFADNYIVTFVNESTNEVYEVINNGSGSTTITLPKPTRADETHNGVKVKYVFAGWECGDGSVTTEDSIDITGDMTFVAKWKMFKETTVYVKASSFTGGKKYVIAAEVNGSQIPIKNDSGNVKPGDSLTVNQGYYLLSAEQLTKSEGEYVVVNSDEIKWEVDANSFIKLRNDGKYMIKQNEAIGLTSSTDKDTECNYIFSKLQIGKGNSNSNKNYVRYNLSAFIISDQNNASTFSIYEESTVYLPYENTLSTANFMIYSEKSYETNAEEKEVVSESDETLNDLTKENDIADDSMVDNEEAVTESSIPDDSGKVAETPDTSVSVDITPSDNEQESSDESDAIPKSPVPVAILPDEQTQIISKEEENQEDAPLEES